MNAGVCDDDVAGRLFRAWFVSEKPHCGQNVACLRISALHCGHRVRETDVTEGGGCCEGTEADESCAVSFLTACILSKSCGKSG